MIGPGEDVAGVAELPRNPQGLYEYESEFEIIAPAPGQPANEVIFIEGEISRALRRESREIDRAGLRAS
jgi:hypothetical protein